MLTMTCQSSLLIRALNELFLPVCTLEFDFQVPRQLQFIWLHARETALLYFSGSTALLKGRHTVLKKGLFIPFYSILFHMTVSKSIHVFYAESKPEKKCISSANNLTEAQKRHQKYQPLCLCTLCYEFVLQHHAALKCHIQRWRSWYAEKRIQQKHSRLDACHEAGAINHKEWSCFYLITKGLCAVFVPVAVVCSSMSFSTLCSPVFLHCKVLYCSSNCFGPLDAWEINDAVQNLYEFISRP